MRHFWTLPGSSKSAWSSRGTDSAKQGEADPWNGERETANSCAQPADRSRSRSLAPHADKNGGDDENDTQQIKHFLPLLTPGMGVVTDTLRQDSRTD